jgi:hypothetical protein
MPITVPKTAQTPNSASLRMMGLLLVAWPVGPVSEGRDHSRSCASEKGDFHD